MLELTGVGKDTAEGYGCLSVEPLSSGLGRAPV